MAHEEAIKCPKCDLKQFGTVQFNELLQQAEYQHTCRGCGHIITYDDWEQINATEIK